MVRQRLTLTEALGSFWNYRVLLSPPIKFLLQLRLIIILRDFWKYQVLTKIRPSPFGDVLIGQSAAPSDVPAATEAEPEPEPIPTVRFRVFRAKGGIWEPTVEGWALMEQNPDMPIETPDGPLGKATNLTLAREKIPEGTPRGRVKQAAKSEDG